jgi:hypothetical protein
MFLTKKMGKCGNESGRIKTLLEKGTLAVSGAFKEPVAGGAIDINRTVSLQSLAVSRRRTFDCTPAANRFYE